MKKFIFSLFRNGALELFRDKRVWAPHQTKQLKFLAFLCKAATSNSAFSLSEVPFPLPSCSENPPGMHVTWRLKKSIGIEDFIFKEGSANLKKLNTILQKSSYFSTFSSIPTKKSKHTLYEPKSHFAESIQVHVHWNGDSFMQCSQK